MVSKFWRNLFGPRGRSTGSGQRETPFWMDQEEWREAFQDASLLANGPRQVEEAQGRIVGRLMRAYESHERLGRQHATLLEGVVRALDFCEGLRPASPEVEILHSQLLGLLADQGLAPWSPPPGEPVPEGCEVVGVVPSEKHPPGAVERVVAPAYLWHGRLLFRPARVLMTAEAEPKESAAPEEPAVIGHAAEEEGGTPSET